ncbi:hypothetical protein HY339_01925 [Candidatus Gottesmanbacteria bacterium]|nr:hypothetical protein [Candidatus Gottesmanbacteria bacterium]
MKKFGLPILVGLLIGGIASAGYLWWVRNKPAPVEQSAAPTPAPVQLLTWTDPNGFTFQYPEGLNVNRHDEDKENYAHIEFTHPDHPGKIIIWGKDPARGVTDTASWLKNEKRFTGASVLDTQLGGQKAAKVMVEGVTRMLVVGTIYDSIIWSVEATLDDAQFWTGVHATIVDSFAFVPVKEPGTAASSDPAPIVEDVAVDEEEVVE